MTPNWFLKSSPRSLKPPVGLRGVLLLSDLPMISLEAKITELKNREYFFSARPAFSVFWRNEQDFSVDTIAAEMQ